MIASRRRAALIVDRSCGAQSDAQSRDIHSKSRGFINSGLGNANSPGRCTQKSTKRAREAYIFKARLHEQPRPRPQQLKLAFPDIILADLLTSNLLDPFRRTTSRLLCRALFNLRTSQIVVLLLALAPLLLAQIPI